MSDFQKQARTMSKKAKEMKIDLSYTQALEIIATTNGYECWAAMKKAIVTKSPRNVELCVENYNLSISGNTINMKVKGYENAYQLKLFKDDIQLYCMNDSFEDKIEDIFRQEHENSLVCKYCGEKDCSLSCDESQAGGFGDPDFKYFELPYFYSRKDSGSFLVRVPTKILSDKSLVYDEEDRIIEFSVRDHQIDTEDARYIQEPIEISEKEYMERCKTEPITKNTLISSLDIPQEIKNRFLALGVKEIFDLTRRTRGEWIRSKNMSNSTLKKYIDPLFLKLGLDYYYNEELDGFRYFEVITKKKVSKFIKIKQDSRWNDTVIFDEDAVIEEAIKTKQILPSEISDHPEINSITKADYETNTSK